MQIRKIERIALGIGRSLEGWGMGDGDGKLFMAAASTRSEQIVSAALDFWQAPTPAHTHERMHGVLTHTHTGTHTSAETNDSEVSARISTLLLLSLVPLLVLPRHSLPLSIFLPLSLPVSVIFTAQLLHSLFPELVLLPPPPEVEVLIYEIAGDFH